MGCGGEGGQQEGEVEAPTRLHTAKRRPRSTIPTPNYAKRLCTAKTFQLSPPPPSPTHSFTHPS